MMDLLPILRRTLYRPGPACGPQDGSRSIFSPSSFENPTEFHYVSWIFQDQGLVSIGLRSVRGTPRMRMPRCHSATAINAQPWPLQTFRSWTRPPETRRGDGWWMKSQRALGSQNLRIRRIGSRPHNLYHLKDRYNNPKKIDWFHQKIQPTK